MSLITFEQAQRLAQLSAVSVLKAYLPNANAPVLSSEYLEAKNCWLFFRSKEIQTPPYAALATEWSYAVSKKGTVRQFYVFADREQMKVELTKLSDHFGQNCL